MRPTGAHPASVGARKHSETGDDSWPDATDMGVTAMYSDYVLPIAHHYERQDFMLGPGRPTLQVLDAAVPPLGEAIDDFELFVAPQKRSAIAQQSAA